MVDLKNFFEPRRVAVIGASRNPSKVGHVIFKNIIDGGFEGSVIPINPNAESIFNHISYPSVTKIKGRVDLAVIAVPAEHVLHSVKECYKKGIRDVLIVTAGFKEVGNAELEESLKRFLKRKRMRCIGVNCLGIYDSYNKLDTLFLPRYRLRRPSPGGISFVCQSGAVGSAILDIATDKGHKFSKFISYGNATQIDESDLIEYLGKDKNTKVICLYVEGIRDGEKFYRVAKEVSKKKPIIALKGGLSEAGTKATMSHTGSLAGKKEVYFGVFNQTGVIRTDSLEEMFHIASLAEKGMNFRGNKIQIVTNGGGYGIIATDNISNSKNLAMASISPEVEKDLKKKLSADLPVHNPLDLLGDAKTSGYKIALDELIKDKGIDGILVVALYQTPLLTTDIVEVISEAHKQTQKPIMVVSTGGEFTDVLSEALEETGVPTFSFPEHAVKAMDKLVWYQNKKKTL
jgi:acetate---CoA ligase (ADP-forming)